MQVKNNKLILQEFLDLIWFKRQYHLATEFVATQAEIKSPIMTGIGPNCLQQVVSKWHQMFPDLTTKSEKIIIDSDQNMAVTNFSCQGYQAANNKLLQYEGSGFYKFCPENSGKIISYSSIVNITPIIKLEYSEDTRSKMRYIGDVALTLQEVRCLALWLVDQTYQEIAITLGNISKFTVKKHLENIRVKLHLTKRQELFKILQIYGLLIDYLDYGTKLSCFGSETGPY